MLSNTLLKDLLFVSLFSNLAALKRRRLRKLGEIAGAIAATPAVDEPRRAVTPPADEHHAEGEVEEVASSPARATTPPTQQEAAEEEAATEAAGASVRPDEAEAQEATMEPPPEGEASTRTADEPEAAAGADTTGGQEEEKAPEPTDAGAGDERTPNP